MKVKKIPQRTCIITKEKLPKVPIMAAAVACQKDMPKPRKNDPYEIAKNETLAAAHGQNKDLAEPLRSDSEIKLIPFTSMLFEIFAIGDVFN